jgi:hypothetical protein
MASLSVFNEDAKIAAVCANPIYLDSSIRIQSNMTLAFDVLEIDASSLKQMIWLSADICAGITSFLGHASKSRARSCSLR